MKIHYDPKEDALYIELAKGKYEVSREISDAVVVDEDKDGKVLGIGNRNLRCQGKHHCLRPPKHFYPDCITGY